MTKQGVHNWKFRSDKPLPSGPNTGSNPGAEAGTKKKKVRQLLYNSENAYARGLTGGAFGIRLQICKTYYLSPSQFIFQLMGYFSCNTCSEVNNTKINVLFTKRAGL